MPVVNPGIRRYIGSAIQRLFNSASFSAPLTHSLTLERGTGTPTFTRATTGTVQDNEGILRTAIAGCARFTGARMVRNLLAATQAMHAAPWAAVVTGAATITPTSGQSDPFGGTTATKLVFSASNTGDVSAWRQAISVISGNTHTSSLYIRADAPVTMYLRRGASAVTGALSVTTEWQQLDVLANTAPSTTLNFDLTPKSDFVTGTAGATVYVCGAQIEDVTGQSDQRAGEYASVGVPGDWYGTDLVTNGTFDTDTTGWSATNSSLSVVSGGMRVTNVGANAGYGYQAITTVVGTKYVIRADITLGTSSSFGVYVGNAPGAGTLGGLSGSASGTFTSEFTATATTTYLNPINLQAVDGRYTTFDNIVVKPAVYHGAGVDGVKYFDTDLSGNPIAASTLKGYLAEPAATNLCLQSNAYNTAPWSNTYGTIAFTQNAIGPDGALSAWTGTDSDAAITSYGAQSMTLTAANWTQSILVKKTVGAQASYPCFGAYRGSTDIALCTIDTSNGIATVWTAYTGLTVVTSSARCSSFNDQFWLVELTLLGTAAVWTQCLMKIPAGTTNPTQSTGILNVTLQGTAVFFGGQMELGSAATSYIPTTTTAVARNADVLTYTGGDIANLKTLAATFRREVGVSAAGAILYLTDGTLNNTNQMYLNNATQHGMAGVTGGVVQWGGNSSNAYVPGTAMKCADSVGTNDAKSDFNGVAQTPDATVTVPIVTQMCVGHLNGATQLNGHVGHIYGWTRNLSQSELGAIDR